MPKSEMTSFVERKAYEKAKRLLVSADLHMSLEDQKLKGDLEPRIQRLKKKLIDEGTPLPDEWKKDLVPMLKHLKIVAELDEVEEENIIEGLVWLDDCKDDGLDWMFWFKLYKNLFNKVWIWADKFRDRELANDDFNHPVYMKENIKKLEGHAKEHRQVYINSVLKARREGDFSELIRFMFGS